MSENESKTVSENEPENTKEFILDDLELNPLSSSENIKSELSASDQDEDILSLNDVPPPSFLDDAGLSGDEEETAEAIEKVDPIFAALAEPQLPELQKENRARLLMQSPNRLFFYWSIKNNPFQTLGKVLDGQQSSYQLVAKFVNQRSEHEQIFPVEPVGNYWFDAESDASYQAEIGFYAVNRPYFRIMFSNLVETPRKTPSPRQASESDWAISAAHFAEVLDNSGFTRDAFEVALAGDDEDQAKFAAQTAFSEFLDTDEPGFSKFNHEEVRFALLALASGVSLEQLRGQISDALFLVLQENLEKLNAERALASLQNHFDIFTEEVFEEETTGATVYGASLLNFPKSLKKRTVPKTLAPKTAPDTLAARLLSKLSPVSSSDSGK